MKAFTVDEKIEQEMAGYEKQNCFIELQIVILFWIINTTSFHWEH